MEPDPYQRIAVVKPCCIGDCVMSLPVVQSLAGRCDGAAIDIFVGEHSRSVFEGRPDVEATQPVADIPAWRDVPGLAMRLRAGRYDLIVVLDRSRYVHLAARLAGADQLTLLERGPGNTRHEIDLYLDTLRAVGIDPVTTVPDIRVSEKAAARALEFNARLGGDYVVIHPGGAQNPGALMPSKRWPLERWIEVASWARVEGFHVVLTGSSGERKLCERIVSAIGGDGIHVGAGELDLLESAAVIDRACLYVGPDTGLSHMAAATGTPTVSIFGPTNPVRYGPRGPLVRVLAPPESSKLPDVDLRTFQKPRPEVATDRVTVAEVVEACRQLLFEQGGRR